LPTREPRTDVLRYTTERTWLTTIARATRAKLRGNCLGNKNQS
jgi:hypothetical protein